MTPETGGEADRSDRGFESALEKSRFAGLQLSDRPLTAARTTLGAAALFMGLKAGFANEVLPACAPATRSEGSGDFGGGHAWGPT